MILRVRPNRVLYTPSNEAWAKPGDCFEVDEKDPSIAAFLKRHLNRSCEWVEKASRMPLVDVPATIRDASSRRSGEKRPVKHTQELPAKGGAAETTG